MYRYMIIQRIWESVCLSVCAFVENDNQKVASLFVYSWLIRYEGHDRSRENSALYCSIEYGGTLFCYFYLICFCSVLFCLFVFLFLFFFGWLFIHVRSVVVSQVEKFHVFSCCLFSSLLGVFVWERRMKRKNAIQFAGCTFWVRRSPAKM
jgi:hypothetical protein